LSLLQLGTRLPPVEISRAVSAGLLRELSKGKDVLHLDVDAFLLRDPWRELRDTYPTADIVGSADCAGPGPSMAQCGWFMNEAYRRRHGARNPLAEVGFMVNTGVAYFRSGPRTLDVVRAADLAVQEGRSTNEQTALNEELAERRCHWATLEGTPSPGGLQAFALLSSKALVGHCRDGLQVVVLPMSTVSRKRANASAGLLAFHPGGNSKHKIQVLPAVQALCQGS
jgi:hypothetical protein